MSCYHTFYNEEHGKETIPTLYMYRHITKPYHVDYCFASNDLYTKKLKVEVGLACDYLGHSDHMPVIVELG